jgi:hypothetical protein
VVQGVEADLIKEGNNNKIVNYSQESNEASPNN